MITIRAHAKINLTLEVLGKYEDGYHQIASVMQMIGLHDTISLQSMDNIELSCNIPVLNSSENLVMKAAHILQEATGCTKGAYIYLEKQIPLASGLGGGSSDAAAALKGLNELWETNLSIEYLRDIASRLGSDVTFFLGERTSLIEGRGEIVTPLPLFPKTWLVLLKPSVDIPNKTQKMYSALKPHNFTEGQFSKRMVDLLNQNADIDSSMCYNTFEEVAFSYTPQLAEYRQALLGAGATAVHLTGAGPTLFAMVCSESKGMDICRNLDGEKYLTETM